MMRGTIEKSSLKRTHNNLVWMAQAIQTKKHIVARKILEKVEERANQNLNNSLVQGPGQFQIWKDMETGTSGREPRIVDSWEYYETPTGMVLENSSPHAHMKEFGTGPKQTSGYPMIFYAYGHWLRGTSFRGQPPSFFLRNAMNEVSQHMEDMARLELWKEMKAYLI